MRPAGSSLRPVWTTGMPTRYDSLDELRLCELADDDDVRVVGDDQLRLPDHEGLVLDEVGDVGVDGELGGFADGDDQVGRDEAQSDLVVAQREGKDAPGLYAEW